MHRHSRRKGQPEGPAVPSGTWMGLGEIPTFGWSEGRPLRFEILFRRTEKGSPKVWITLVDLERPSVTISLLCSQKGSEENRTDGGYHYRFSHSEI